MKKNDLADSLQLADYYTDIHFNRKVDRNVVGVVAAIDVYNFSVDKGDNLVDFHY